MQQQLWGLVIAGTATALVILRPFGWPEAIWAVGGAALLVALGFLPPLEAWHGVLQGLDVYLFLAGMMLLSELARQEGLFDWLAASATAWARGSATRLFLLVYAVGTLVTVFLSNDATAVVLTPAVYAATRAARVADPLPYLFVCAFIANAASFVLPISNPANLVVFGGGHMPPLGRWFATFALPSMLSIIATYLALRLTQARSLAAEILARDVARPALSRQGLVAGLGILCAAAVLIAASALGRDLGMPTLVAGVATAAVIAAVKREAPLPALRDIAWGVLPLVAGLFVFVDLLQHAGIVAMLAEALGRGARRDPGTAALASGLLVGVGSNLVNNLPAGLVAGGAVQSAALPDRIAAAILVGVDLGPNLSVTGSLATILWLGALRREQQHVGAWAFLRLGCLVMPPALLVSLAALAFGPWYDIPK